MPTPFWCFIVGEAVEQGTTATAGGPGTLLADVSIATCGRRAGSRSVREEELAGASE